MKKEVVFGTIFLMVAFCRRLSSKNSHINSFSCDNNLQVSAAISKTSDFTFNLYKNPFSCFGSHMSLLCSYDDVLGTDSLILTDLTKGREADKLLFQINPVNVNNKHEKVHYTATPIELRGKTKDGNISIFFESPQVLHLCSDNLDLQFSGRFEGNAYSFPFQEDVFHLNGQYNNTFIVRDKGIAITVKSGILSYNNNCFLLKKDSKRKIEVVVEQYFGDWIPKHYTTSKEIILDRLKKEYSEWENKIASVSPEYEEGRKLASYMSWSCMYEPRGNITRYGMSMSKGFMLYIWSWDHCFNALGLSYSHPKLSWDQFMIMFDHQDNRTGALPDYIGANNKLWTVKKPPIHGWTLSLLLQQYVPEKDKLEEVYNKLSNWTNYWLNCRDDDGNGLPQYYHGMDSGWDNGTCFDVGMPAEGPDLAAFLVLQMEVLSNLAEKLSDSLAAKKWNECSKTMLYRLIKEFWNGEKFITRRTGTHEVNPNSQSLMSYLPIVLGKRLPKDIREKMISDLKKEGFLLTPYGLASESPKSLLYESDGYWRGPIWAPTTLIVIDGLKQCGELGLAKEIAKRFCDTCMKSGFAENFDALTGEALRDVSYTWTSSVFLVLAHEYLK